MTADQVEDALVVARPAAFAALADELQALAGNPSWSEAHTASPNDRSQAKFTAADRERLRKIFGDPDALV